MLYRWIGVLILGVLKVGVLILSNMYKNFRDIFSTELLFMPGAFSANTGLRSHDAFQATDRCTV